MTGKCRIRRAPYSLTTQSMSMRKALEPLIAAIGEIGRFQSAQKLVSYFGLNPSVRQSGLTLARHGHITKIGRAHADRCRGGRTQTGNHRLACAFEE